MMKEASQTESLPAYIDKVRLIPNEVDIFGLDWTHENVRNKLINHQKKN